MQRKTLVILACVFSSIAFLFIIGVLGLAFALGGGSSRFEEGNIGIIDLFGEIVSADSVFKVIEEIEGNDNIKAVVLRIESPGGSVAASQEIYEAVKRLDSKKPVIASLGNIAASGGYYAALGARKIFANSGTITGSIGVRMEHLRIDELLNWAKMKHQTLKSGKFKDMVSPFKELNDEEKAILQALLDDIHLQFKDAVAKERKLPIEKVNEFADGRVFTGLNAKGLNLVDELGGFTMAVDELGKIANISKPKVARHKTSLGLRDILDIVTDFRGVLGAYIARASSDMFVSHLPSVK